MAHPERFELPTFWFVARRSIQLSYGCVRPRILAAGCVRLNAPRRNWSAGPEWAGGRGVVSRAGRGGQGGLIG